MAVAFFGVITLVNILPDVLTLIITALDDRAPGSNTLIDLLLPRAAPRPTPLYVIIFTVVGLLLFTKAYSIARLWNRAREVKLKRPEQYGTGGTEE